MAKNKPKIRFKGFEDEWDYTTLGCLGDTTSGIGFPIKEQGGKEGIPFFKVSDMNIIGNERILKNSNNYVTKLQIDHNRWNPITNIPAIFFAKIGAALLQNRKRLVNEPFLLDNNTMAFSMNNKNGDFFLSLFETLYLPKYAQTGALPSYGEKDIKKIEVNIPSPSEQQKIGEYFKQLDNLIEAREKKLEKLRQFKMAMLDKMFPKEGESVPAVRFRGFAEPWKLMPITECVTFDKGRGYSKGSLKPLGTPILLYGMLYTDYNTNIDIINQYAQKEEWAKISIGNEVVVPASGETAEDIARASAINLAGVILGGDLNIIYPNK